MPELLEDQYKFAFKFAYLIVHAHNLGYQVTFGNSITLNIFKDGRLLQNTEDHRELGEWWESQGGTWGGRFNDGNHYSWGEY